MERTDAFTKETRSLLEEVVLKTPADRIDGTSPKEVILDARILWTYSAGYRILKKKEYLMEANRFKDFFVEHFIDHKYGGVYWSLNQDGTRLDTGKRFRAFGAAIYGLSEYVRATNDESALGYAVNLFETTEKEGFNEKTGLYIDMRARDWGEADTQIGDEFFCTHLHILEGYANLYKVWKEERLRRSIIRLLSILADKIMTAPCKDGECSCRRVTEASWQMLKAAFAVKDIYVINKVRPVVQELLSEVSAAGCGKKVCEKAETVTASLWAWKYLNDTGAAGRALSIWDEIKTVPFEDTCGKCMFRLGRMCVEAAEMF